MADRFDRQQQHTAPVRPTSAGGAPTPSDVVGKFQAGRAARGDKRLGSRIAGDATRPIGSGGKPQA